MKYLSLFIAIIVISTSLLNAQENTQEKDVTFIIHTDFGDMTGVLFNDTPLHRDNFVKLVNEGWYNGSPFHRVIQDFMIQGGGKDGKNDPGYKIDAEILPQHIHQKGALAAARMSDQVNPQKQSSGSQFYIVQGQKLTPEKVELIIDRKNMGQLQKVLASMLERPENSAIKEQVYHYQSIGNMDSLQIAITPLIPEAEKIVAEQGDVFNYSPEQKEALINNGGTPHLDGEYTVFGQITSGLEVIDKIAAQPTAAGNKPVSDIMMEIEIIE